MSGKTALVELLVVVVILGVIGAIMVTDLGHLLHAVNSGHLR